MKDQPIEYLFQKRATARGLVVAVILTIIASLAFGQAIKQAVNDATEIYQSHELPLEYRDLGNVGEY